MKKVAVVALPSAEAAAQDIRREVNALSSLVLSKAKSLVTIPDAGSYALADGLLSKIRRARSVVKEKIDGILDPINTARNAVLKLRHELDDPLAEAEDSLRSGMKQFKLDEARLATEEQRRRDEEAAALRKEAERKEALELAARTESMRERLAQQRQELEEKAEQVEAAPVPVPVQARNSGTRTVQRWRVTSMKDLVQFLTTVGMVRGAGFAISPYSLLTVNRVGMDDCFRSVPGFKNWPGIEIWDDIQIVGRRS